MGGVEKVQIREAGRKVRLEEGKEKKRKAMNNER